MFFFQFKTKRITIFNVVNSFIAVIIKLCAENISKIICSVFSFAIIVCFIKIVARDLPGGNCIRITKMRAQINTRKEIETKFTISNVVTLFIVNIIKFCAVNISKISTSAFSSAISFLVLTVIAPCKCAQWSRTPDKVHNASGRLWYGKSWK